MKLKTNKGKITKFYGQKNLGSWWASLSKMIRVILLVWTKPQWRVHGLCEQHTDGSELFTDEL